MAEVLLKFAEYQVYDTGLLSGLQLLVELKLFNDQVVIGRESLLNILDYV